MIKNFWNSVKNDFGFVFTTARFFLASWRLGGESLKLPFFFILLFVLTAPIAQAKDAFDDLNKLYQNKEYKKMESICLERVKVNPKSMDSYYFLSLINLNQGKEQESEGSGSRINCISNPDFK